MKKVFVLSVLCFFISLFFVNPVYAQNTNESSAVKVNVNYECEEDLIEIMFDKDSQVRLRNGSLVDFKSDALNGVDQILEQLDWHNWYRISDVDEEIIDKWSIDGERNTGKPVYNMNNIYRLQVPKGLDIWKLSNSLQNLPGIGYAKPVPKPMELPIPGNFQSQQGYLNPASSTPTGIDAAYAWTQTGGTGIGITVCDLEYSWNYNHADITKGAGSSLNSWTDTGYGTDHGTAVIGELVADNNGWGTTGICYGAGLKTCGTYYGTPLSWNVAGAINLAIAALSAGDIILLEQQWEYTPLSGDYIPIEWWGSNSPSAQSSSPLVNPVYVAIVNAVANGIHVVEAGGNGNVNTNGLTWAGNSGAIIVGAGGTSAGNDLQRLSFSSYGQRFDMQGWGENVYTTGYGNYYFADGVNYYYTHDFNGTSSASPVVAGALACAEGYYYASYSSMVSPSTMRSHLKTHGTAQVFGTAGNIGSRPDLYAAINNFTPPAQTIDFGDLPDSYLTSLAINGARHLVGNVFLGLSIDPEGDGIPSPNADSDDNTGIDDEDGVIFTNPLSPGGTTNITVTASMGGGLLQGWIDFNNNGFFDIPSEEVFLNQPLIGGPNNLSFTTPASAVIGSTYARFRYSTISNVIFYSYCPDGEVEDYKVDIVTQGSSLKWEQLPDLSPTGMDVDATWQPDDPDNPPILLADDFLCTETGYITDIHIWGSWLNDYLPFFENPAAVQFTFSIHSDIPDPDGTGPEYSMPGDMLWMRTWIPGTDDIEEIVSGPEDWYNPFYPMWLDDNHQMCYKYNYILDPQDYFLQEGTAENPIVYWLDVQAEPFDPDPNCRFGWKTSLDHWNDDAVWIDAMEQYNGPWNELIYPLGHEYETESVDLAFQITTEGGGPTDEYDFGDAPDAPYPTLSANNGANHFLDGMTYLGAGVDAEPDGQPDPTAIGDDNDIIYPPSNDDEDGVIFLTPFIQNQVANIDVVASVGNGLLNAWIDFDLNGSWADPGEQVFVDVSLIAGINNLNISVPSSAIPGQTFIRFRFDTSGGLNFDGAAPNGEVEDYEVFIEEGQVDEFDFGDAPEEALAYPSLGVTGIFPTCVNVNVAGWIQHNTMDLYFGPSFDLENEGNAGLCPTFNPNLYNQDECFADGDAGLIIPDGFTIIGPVGSETVQPCTGANNQHLGYTCTNAIWGIDIDIDLHNHMPTGNQGYLNLYIDWNQDGMWSGSSTCPGYTANEHALVDFPISNPYDGLVSSLMAVGTTLPIGPNAGYVWARFTLTDVPVTSDWDATGFFEDGETEDYLLLILEQEDQLDFGDAADPLYPTLLASNGANHLIDGITYLGASVDAETDGQQNPNALGDDNDGNDDEDGVIFDWPLEVGNPCKITVNASVASGLYSGWVDFDGNGSWADPGEQVFADVSLDAGNNSLYFTVPFGTTAGLTSYARFRYSNQAGLSYDGAASDGEVEDYEVDIDEVEDYKWAQYPDISLPGLHAHDYVVATYQSIVLADDWLCNGGIVTDIHWWGNYELNPQSQELRGGGIDHFHISIHADDPTGTCLPVDPEIVGFNVPFSSLVEQNTGLVNLEGCSIYKYDYVLPVPFQQEEGTRYWVDITAFSSDPTDPAYWRWQESMRSYYPILCGAAEKINPTPGTWSTITWAQNRYSDMAFIITSVEPEPMDLGDAKDPTYPTLLGNNGAAHIIDPTLYLGSTIDAELDGQPDPNALGDDNNGVDDEDGVSINSIFTVTPGGSIWFDITASKIGTLSAWIDWNVNGLWGDLGDQVATNLALSSGNNVVIVPVPANAVIGTTYARFRFSSISGLSYTGLAPDGEVEDYEITIVGNVDVSLKAFLEGPFNGATMNTDLNSSNLIPLNQPYNSDALAKWYYTGTESVVSIPNTNVVDWVMVEFRDALSPATATGATIVSQQAAFILADGSIVGLDGISPVQTNGIYSHNLYVVIWHRNHLGVMSAGSLVPTGINQYSYDFTGGPGQAYLTGQKNLGGGIYGLAGGDGKPDGTIDNQDMINIWSPAAGTTGYLIEDYNMDSQVDNKDKNDVWYLNTGSGTQVPN